jgi:REP element-mobilizing transposase RayT
MARPLRLEFPGAVYHLTSRGNARQKVFFTDADRELFLSTLSGVVRRYHWICHAYCLMANHYHLLIETPNQPALRPVRLRSRHEQGDVRGETA